MCAGGLLCIGHLHKSDCFGQRSLIGGDPAPSCSSRTGKFPVFSLAVFPEDLFIFRPDQDLQRIVNSRQKLRINISAFALYHTAFRVQQQSGCSQA